MTRRHTPDPVGALSALDTVWSPDFDDYAAGRIDSRSIRCVLCGHVPCGCPPFGTPEYFDLIDRVHRKGSL